jgi:hypothetical protein
MFKNQVLRENNDIFMLGEFYLVEKRLGRELGN